MRRIYFDANATTPPRSEALEAMAAVHAFGPTNASSVHEEGRRARARVEDAREVLASTLGCAAEELVFTSGASEANATAIASLGAQGQAQGRTHCVVSAVEHPSVLGPVGRLEEEGFEISWIAPDAQGRIAPEAFIAAFRPDTAFFAWMRANNEIGNLYDVAAVTEEARGRGVESHVDCVQALGKTALDLRALGATTAALSAHKIGGPQGVGALYLRRGQRLRPLVVGGHQERERRAGTENVAGVIGFATAARAAVEELGEVAPRLADLRDHLWARVAGEIEGVALNGDPRSEGRVSNTLNFSACGTEGETMLIALDLEGFAVSSGSACTSGSLEPSHVLLAMGLDVERARAALRISLLPQSTRAEVNALADLLPQVVETVRQAAPRAPGGEASHA